MKRKVYHQEQAGKAMYVVMHGLRQIGRGRQPSMSFRGVRNPAEAFKYAALALIIEAELQQQVSLIGNLYYVEPGVYGLYADTGCLFETLLAKVMYFTQKYRSGAVQIDSHQIDCGRLTFETRSHAQRIRLRPDSDLTLIGRDYYLPKGVLRSDRDWIGPYPKPELSAEELQREAEIYEALARRARDENILEEQEVRDRRAANQNGYLFPTASVLSVVMGCNLGSDADPGTVIGYMTCSSSHLGEAVHCTPTLICQHPWLGEVERPAEGATDEEIALLVERYEAIHGTELLVRPLKPEDPVNW